MTKFIDYPPIESLKSRVRVESIEDFGTIDSTKEYYLDGKINAGSTSIIVPDSGITINGASFDISGIYSDDDNFTLFTGANAGNIILRNLSIEISGTNSQVYDCTAAIGNEAIRLTSVNYDNCTSLGELTGYRQGLETSTGRFGGTPELILSGTWLGGYRATPTIAGNIDDSMTGNLFTQGTSFSMAGRFTTDINADLGATAGLTDFQPNNFTGSNRLSFNGCFISRNGVFDPTDSTITPNISHADKECLWLSNVGLENTIEGGLLKVTTEAVTTVSAIDTYYDLAGTFTASQLQHFDSPANGHIRHLDDTPSQFNISGQIVLESTANDVVDIKIVIYRAATMTFEDSLLHVSRVINNLSGGRDIAYYILNDFCTLYQNDYIKIQVENKTTISDITAEIDSFIRLDAR